MHLTEAVSTENANIAPCGRKEILFDEAHATFIRTAPRVVLGDKEPPSRKSLEDRLKVILCKRRGDVKRTAGLSGIVEVYREMETLGDDLILGIDEHAEEERAAKNEKLEKEKRLTAVGLELRHRALNRKQGISSRCRSRSHCVPKEVDAEVDGGGRPGSPSPTGTNTRRRIHNESDDGAREALVRDMAVRQEHESLRLKLEEQLYELENKRIEEEEERRFEANQESMRRKTILEEKKTVVEMEERKQAMVERSRMIDVFAALRKNLE